MLQVLRDMPWMHDNIRKKLHKGFQIQGAFFYFWIKLGDHDSIQENFTETER